MSAHYIKGVSGEKQIGSTVEVYVCSKFEEGLNSKVKLSLFGKVVELRSISMVLRQDYCLNSGQERMDSMKSWAGIEGVFVL